MVFQPLSPYFFINFQPFSHCKTAWQIEQSQKRYMVSDSLCLTSFINVEFKVSLVVNGQGPHDRIELMKLFLAFFTKALQKHLTKHYKALRTDRRTDGRTDGHTLL